MENQFVLPEGQAEDAIDVMVHDNYYLAKQYGNDVYITDMGKVLGKVQNCDIRAREDDSEASETDFSRNEEMILAYIRKHIHKEPTLEEIHQHATIIGETLSDKDASQIREYIAENVNFSHVKEDREGVIVAIINRTLHNPTSLKKYITQLYVRSF